MSDMQRFIEAGSRILSDGMASYQQLPEYGYVHELVVDDRASYQRLPEYGYVHELVVDDRASYQRLPEYGYIHELVVHDRECVDSDDRSVHTQNVECATGGVDDSGNPQLQVCTSTVL